MTTHRVIQRRAFLSLLLLTFLIAGLMLRLWWIQIGFTHRFSSHQIDLVKSSIKQRQQTIMLNSGRGEIADKNGQSLTGSAQKALIIFPIAQGGVEGQQTITQVAHLAHLSEDKIRQAIYEGKSPTIIRDDIGTIHALSDEQTDAINRLHIPGILALTVTERYPKDGIARQTIGYISQNPQVIKSQYETELLSRQISLETLVGASGLERSFDLFLQGSESSSLSYYVDGKGHPLKGLDVRYKANENAFYPLTLVTTLDLRIQKNLEEIADEVGMKEGSIVVLDADTSDVVALVSRPNYDQSKISLADGGWQNHAFKQLEPGSVFKTVVAAAALGEGIVSPTDTFLCEGEYGKYGFSCWKKGGHGKLTMKEAFADSCNVAFAQIAKKVGGAKIEEYAKKLGVSTPVGWSTDVLYKLENFHQLQGEDHGGVFAPGSSKQDEGVLIQTAIGQRDVRMTPLQAANLMATIARGGKPNQVRLVSRITYRNGMTFHHFTPHTLDAKGIDRVTAMKLMKFMEAVVQQGTGQSLISAAWTVAGKSGTAQTFASGQQMDHQWFAGITPVEKPRYAIAVVVENQSPNAPHKATQVFKKVVDSLASGTTESDPLHEKNPQE
ncbi:peptidoglycan D,D-transpeptidase FtsI family protein [Brevibacillus ginsengisoli]|uniref:peptidoglycan D,D-transpeptidase FtsI family protein n=1 Tax=Brevibacillus ginsengisoli TaxID=363854 RepID=UPI003CF06F95